MVNNIVVSWYPQATHYMGLYWVRYILVERTLLNCV